MTELQKSLIRGMLAVKYRDNAEKLKELKLEEPGWELPDEWEGFCSQWYKETGVDLRLEFPLAYLYFRVREDLGGERLEVIVRNYFRSRFNHLTHAYSALSLEHFLFKVLLSKESQVYWLNFEPNNPQQLVDDFKRAAEKIGRRP